MSASSRTITARNESDSRCTSTLASNSGVPTRCRGHTTCRHGAFYRRTRRSVRVRLGQSDSFYSGLRMRRRSQISRVSRSSRLVRSIGVRCSRGSRLHCCRGRRYRSSCRSRRTRVCRVLADASVADLGAPGLRCGRGLPSESSEDVTERKTGRAMRMARTTRMGTGSNRFLTRLTSLGPI